MHNKPVEQDCKVLQKLSLLIEEVQALKMLVLKESVQPDSPMGDLARRRALAGTNTLTTDKADRGMSTADYMTGQEIAALLRVSYRHITECAQQGRIPAIKVGRTWRFNRPDVMAWIRAQSSQGVPH